MQIFAKARAAAQAEITRLKEKQAKEIEALRQQYAHAAPSGSLTDSSAKIAELEKKYQDEISSLRQRYEKQIADLNSQNLTTSGSHSNDFTKVQTQLKEANGQLEQAFADLKSWEVAYKDLQAHNQSQKESFEKQIEDFCF